MSTLNVFWDDELIGRLRKVGGQGMAFQYSEHYLALEQPQPISLSLPLQAEAFDAATSKSWFANLLPEGEIRGHIARKLGVSERNEYAILDGIGGDCAGALRLLPESAPVSPRNILVPLPWEELEAKIASTPRPSLLALFIQEGELRLSLAGAQDKLPVHFSNGELALPSGNTASTHLLKISSGSFPDLVQNELFCLNLAKKAGLDVPHAEIAPTKTPILLVERYDRRVHPDKGIRRLHQEDFCQALGVPPETKYESEGGPSLVQIFEALSRGSRSPLPDKRDLLKWVLFNFLIGNADAHAKNISLLYGEFGDNKGPRLAPFYDLVCTQVYDQLSTKPAQKIGGEYRFQYIASRHWDRFAASIDVNPRYLRTIGLELCEKIEKNVFTIADDISHAHSGAETLEKIVHVVEGRIQRLREEFQR
ncbi:type II toxin-antitoxin system HipA family toxin [bacterium]|nr:type II toxin-antitoxin system HipA family toxin [bacterium]